MTIDVSVTDHQAETTRTPDGRTAILPPAAKRIVPRRIMASIEQLGWTMLSVGMFAAIWEICWATGLADPKLLPPPHIFLGNFAEQAKFFNTATRWSIGVDPSAGPSPFEVCVVI